MVIYSDLLQWYHEIPQHPGSRRLEENVGANFIRTGLSTICKVITSVCETCSKMKVTNVVKDGKLPLCKDKTIKPWELLSVNLCGPQKINCEFEEIEKNTSRQVRTAQIWALTMINECSSWPEIRSIQQNYAEEIATSVNDYQFVRYPLPLYCIHNNGGDYWKTMQCNQSQLLSRIHISTVCTRGCIWYYVKCYVVRRYFCQNNSQLKERSAEYPMLTSPVMITKYSLGNLVFERDVIIHKKKVQDCEVINVRRRAQQIKITNAKTDCKQSTYTKFEIR